MERIITLNESNIDNEHICCAFSDKKCTEGYRLKKVWLKEQYKNGYVFRRIDARAKVFIEYVPAEKGWIPLEAPNYLLVNCFWVSGRYKKQGYGTELLNSALEDAKSQGKNGLVTVVGTKKFHFMNDTKWLLKQGFETTQKTDTGFSLLTKKLNPSSKEPKFIDSVLNPKVEDNRGIVVYYSNRCPFTEYYVDIPLKETAKNRNLPLKVVKLETMEQAQSAPTPATIFSLFYKGRFITTDVSICLDSRFDKILAKALR